MQASMASGEGDASSIAMACVHAVACKPPCWGIKPPCRGRASHHTGAWSHHAGACKPPHRRMKPPCRGVQATTQAHEATMASGQRGAPFIVPLPHSLYRCPIHCTAHGHQMAPMACLASSIKH